MVIVWPDNHTRERRTSNEKTNPDYPSRRSSPARYAEIIGLGAILRLFKLRPRHIVGLVTGFAAAVILRGDALSLSLPASSPTRRRNASTGEEVWLWCLRSPNLVALPIMSRFLVILGTTLIVAGLLWPWLKRLPLFHLPGDIIIDRPHFKFFFPITTMLLLSAVISLLAWIFRR